MRKRLYESAERFDQLAMSALVPPNDGKLAEIRHFGFWLTAGCTQFKGGAYFFFGAGCARHDCDHGPGMSSCPTEEGLAEFRGGLLHPGKHLAGAFCVT